MTKDTFKGLSHPESRQKILMLTWEYPPNVVGGLSRHVNGLAVQLASLGAEVHVITAKNGNLPDDEIKNSVYVHRVQPLNDQDSRFLNWIGGLNLAMSARAKVLAEEINFTMIHVHDWLVGAAGISLKEELALPLLATIHATEHGRNRGIFNEIQRAIHRQEQNLIQHADQIIVCSTAMREELHSVFSTEYEKMLIIPNGVDFSESKQAPGRIYPIWEGKALIFSVGRIVAEKGFETIIEVAEIAKRNAAPLYFVVAGKGPMLEEYRRIIAERELENFISFIGYITDEEKTDYFEACNVAVFPSLYEPFGIVVLEAMTQGKPVVASKVGGMKGIVHHMETGMLAVPGDALHFYEQIDFLIKNPQKAAEIGLQSKKMVKSLYGWKRIATETLRGMEEMLLHKYIRQTINESKKI